LDRHKADFPKRFQLLSKAFHKRFQIHSNMAQARFIFVALLLLVAGAGHPLACNISEQERFKQEKIEAVADVYTSQLGVRESGNNEGDEVEKYLASTDLKPGYAWCASFITWTFERAGIEAIHSAWTPDWFPHRLTIYKRGQVTGIPLQIADVFGIYFQNKGRIAHVGFIHRVDGGYVVTVEGNTNGSGAREGDGVYKKRRVKRQVYKVSRHI
jgi:hypothetical protein